MKIIVTIALMFAAMLPAWSAQVFPATTNRSQILYGTNTFWTNTIFRGPVLASNDVTSLQTIYATNFFGLGQVLTNNQSSATTLSNGLTVAQASVNTGLIVSSGSAYVIITNGGINASAKIVGTGNFPTLDGATYVTFNIGGAQKGYWNSSGLNLAGDLAPTGDNARSIGSSSYRFKTMFLSGGVEMSGTNAYVKFSPRSGITNTLYAAGAGDAWMFSITNGASAQAEIYVMDGGGTITLISPHAYEEAPPQILDLDDPFPHVSKELNHYLGKIRWVNYSRGPKQQELLTKIALNSRENWMFLQNKTATQWTNAAAFGKYTNALVKLDELTEGARQLVVTETFVEYNTRLNLTNGNGLVQVSWSEVQTRLSNDVFAAYSSATNAYLAAVAAGDTNAVDPGPYVPRVTEPVPGWLYDRGVR